MGMNLLKINILIVEYFIYILKFLYFKNIKV